MTRRKGEAAQSLAGLRRRLTERDFAIIDGLARHKVMTSAMLAAVYFPSSRAAATRLLTLTELGVLARDLLPSSGAHRYTLGWHGQVIWALAHGHKPPSKAAAELVSHQITFSTQLTHKEAVNAFFARLHRAAPAAEARVTEWLSEAEAATEFDGLRPDAAGSLTWAGDRTLRLWFEHDRGTETLGRLTAKLERYPHRRSLHLKADRVILVEVCGARRLAALARTVLDLGDLAGAACLYEPIDPVTARTDTSARLFDADRWYLLDGTGRTASLADLAAES